MMNIQDLKSAIVGCQINQNQDLTRGISQPEPVPYQFPQSQIEK